MKATYTFTAEITMVKDAPECYSPLIGDLLEEGIEQELKQVHGFDDVHVRKAKIFLTET